MIENNSARRRARRAGRMLPIAIGTALAGLAPVLAGSPAASAASVPVVGPPHILWTRAGPPAGAGVNTPSPQAASNDLLFHGGAVEHVPAVYIVFWGPAWKTGFTAKAGGFTYTARQAESYITNFFANMGGTAYNGLQTQYCDNITYASTSCSGTPYAHFVTNPKVVLHGVWVDPSAVPSEVVTSGLAENLTQDPIATEAVKAANHFTPGAYNTDATYFVYTQPGTSATAYGSVYCAYHSEVTNLGGHGLKYAFMPYVPEQGAGCGANYGYKTNDAYGHGYMDGYSEASGHEYAEAVTDPDTWPTQDGWNDASTSENGDKCAYFDVTALRFGSYSYAVQPLWSNEANSGTGGCPFKRGTGPAPVPPAGYPYV